MRIAQKNPSMMYSIVVQSRCMGDACALGDHFAGEGLTRRLQADYKYERYAPSVRVLRTCCCKFDWPGVDHQRTHENRLCVKRCDGRVKPPIGRETARRSCQPGSNGQPAATGAWSPAQAPTSASAARAMRRAQRCVNADLMPERAGARQAGSVASRCHISRHCPSDRLSC